MSYLSLGFLSVLCLLAPSDLALLLCLNRLLFLLLPDLSELRRDTAEMCVSIATLHNHQGM